MHSPAPLLLNKLPSELKWQVHVSPASVHHRIINSGCYVHISFTVYSSLWKKMTAINTRKTENWQNLLYKSYCTTTVQYHNSELLHVMYTLNWNWEFRYKMHICKLAITHLALNASFQLVVGSHPPHDMWRVLVDQSGQQGAAVSSPADPGTSPSLSPPRSHEREGLCRVCHLEGRKLSTSVL